MAMYWTIATGAGGLPQVSRYMVGTNPYVLLKAVKQGDA